jgi:tetratricopeptide (TPR) repeat protein
MLSPFSQARLEALAAEQEGDPYATDDAWRLALEELYDQDMDEGDNRLRAALILRRLADLWAQRPGDDRLDQSVLEDLVESLELDPDDRSTHLRLIAAHRDARQLKEARSYLKAALERFANDTEVLLEAVETAIAGNAFKKAAGYAKQLLSLDPINVKVQNVLLEAHIGHARKQIEAGKYPLARRELDEASTWARAAAAEGKVYILRGLVELAAGELELGRQLLQQGAERLGGGLAGHFHLLLEGGRLGRAPGTLLKRAQLPKPSGFATREHVLALIHAINAMAEDDKPWLEDSLAPLIEPLRRAATQTFSQPEMELICETLHRHQQLNLLDTYARQAAKRWPERPAFLYHRLYAKGDGLSYGLRSADIDRLGDALVQAREEGDMRTMHRISEFLEPPFHFPSPGGFPPPVDFQREFAEAVDELGVDGVAEMIEAIADPGEFEAFRELLNDNQLRQLIELVASGGDPEAFLRSAIEGLGFSGKRKSRKNAKRKPATDDPDQLDLFE